MAANEVRDGFQASFEFTGHNCPIKSVVANPDRQHFASLDERSIRVWGPQRPGREYEKVAFPPQQANFIQALCYVPRKRIYIAAALDMSIKVYDTSFTLKGSVPLRQRAVLCVAFNPEREELLTAGVDGCSVWKWEESRTKLWNPATKSFATAYALVPVRHLAEVRGRWVGRLELDWQAGRLFAITGASVFVFCTTTGKCLDKLEDIHEQAVTGCLYYDPSHYLVTSGNDGKVKVWSVSRANALVHVFAGHTRAVTAISLHPGASRLKGFGVPGGRGERDMSLHLSPSLSISPSLHLSVFRAFEGVEKQPH